MGVWEQRCSDLKPDVHADMPPQHFAGQDTLGWTVLPLDCQAWASSIVEQGLSPTAIRSLQNLQTREPCAWNHHAICCYAKLKYTKLDIIVWSWPQDMDSVLRIHLKELGVNEEWVWKPDGNKPEKLDKQLWWSNWEKCSRLKPTSWKRGESLAEAKASWKWGMSWFYTCETLHIYK